MEITQLSSSKIFSLDKAQELLPLIYKITEDTHLKVKKLLNRVEAMRVAYPSRAVDLENLVSEEIEKWQNKLRRLGVVPKGTWLVDFDRGDGYFCWKYPETKIQFFHGYKDGFSRRVEIDFKS
jgi:hypothetical protein